MSEETLFSSIRRLMREIRICEKHGGLMSTELFHSANTVDIQMDKYRKLEAIANKELDDYKASQVVKS